MVARLRDAIQRGTLAARPAATAVDVGTLYYDTTNSTLDRSTGAAWESVEGAVGGGSGMTHTYAGYNTAGATWEAMTQRRVFLKTFTLAAAGFCASLGAHLRMNSDDLGQLWTAVYADNAGNPGAIMGVHQPAFISTGHLGLGTATTGAPFAGQWVQFPMGLYLPAGTYWLGIGYFRSAVQTIDIAYDTGTDKYHTMTGDFLINLNHSAFTPTTTTRAYSIRASILT